ncbi:hypothetical protein Tco_0369007 [Tanacetum coccineum]
MSFASSAVTYTSVYTDYETDRAFWGADDEEIYEGGIPRVIVYGYDGLPIQPVAPPSPHYIPGPEDPQTPPVPQDEDERKPMFVQAHDPDYVPEPVYPEYIPLMEEHLALADSTIVPEASISLPPEAEVERLLAMTTPSPSPSPPISLSPPSAGERLARCTTPPAHSSPPPIPSPLLPSSGCPTQIQTFRIASTQALIDAVTTALPSPPLLQSLYIPPPVDRRDDIPESEQPPRKRLCLSTLGSRYEIGESSISRPIGGRGVDYGFVSTVDAEARRVTELAELHEHDTQDLYALLEDAQDRDSIDGGGGGLCFPKGLGSLDRIESGDPSGASDPSYMRLAFRQQTKLAALWEIDCRRQAQMVETLRVIRDMRREMSDMQAELLALREQQRRARQPGPEARIPDH